MNIMEAEEPGEVIQVTPKKGDTNPDWKKSVWVSRGERAWVIVSQGRLDGRANVITAPVLLWVVQKVAAQSEPFRNALIRMLLDSRSEEIDRLGRDLKVEIERLPRPPVHFEAEEDGPEGLDPSETEQVFEALGARDALLRRLVSVFEGRSS